MRTVHRQVEQFAAANGDADALVHAGGRLSYRELNARANRLARALMARGVKRGDRVVIALLPSPELLIAELAVLKAGGAYACPVSRFAYNLRTPFSVLRDGVAAGIDIALPFDVGNTASPNLPVLVRETDPACLVADAYGALTLIISHGALFHGASRSAHPGGMGADGKQGAPGTWEPSCAPWDHWATLIAGGTVTVPTPLPAVVLEPAA